MNCSKLCLFVAGALAVGLLAGAALQEKKHEHDHKAGHDHADMQNWTPPTASAEHQWIKTAYEGTWDAHIESWHAPGGPSEKSTGTETVKAICNGLWFYTEFSGAMGKYPFTGASISGYNETKKKFVGTWVDSFGTALNPFEGTYDKATNTLTEWVEMTMGDHTMKTKMTTEWKGTDQRTMTMYMPMPDGKEYKHMVISYTRKK